MLYNLIFSHIKDELLDIFSLCNRYKYDIYNCFPFFYPFVKVNGYICSYPSNTLMISYIYFILFYRFFFPFACLIQPYNSYFKAKENAKFPLAFSHFLLFYNFI